MIPSRRSVVLSMLTLPFGSLASRFALAADAPKLPAKERMKVFLLIGQSNMAGRGKVEEEDRTPVDRVLMLNKADEWAPAIEPLHFDKPNVAGVGPGFACGRAVAAALPEDTIGLVPCAFGGTSLAQWAPGGKLYTEAVRRAGIALKAGTLAGILWHQGESDSGAAEKLAAYPQKAAELFAALRKELNAPEVSIVVGTLGDFLGERGAAFNAMARKLPDNIPRCAVADAAGLKDKGDKLHFDAAAARELGRRYAAAWLALAKAEPQKRRT